MTSSPVPLPTKDSAVNPSNSASSVLYKRILKAIFRWIGGLLGLLLLLASSLWFWSATPYSLEQTLRWTAYWLQSTEGISPLTVEQAHGSLRHGGRIERLVWKSDGLTLAVDQLEWRWPNTFLPHLLLQRRLTVDVLRATSVQLDDHRPSTSLTPPTDWRWSWVQEVDIPAQVKALTLAQPTALTTGPIAVHYRYMPSEVNAPPLHTLDLDGLDWAQGHYQGQAQLQAEAPMALSLKIEGKIRTQAPQGTPLTLKAQWVLNGPLASADAALQTTLTVQAAKSTGAAYPPPSLAPTLHATATVMPWQTVPLARGDLTLQHIDLHALWPQAPHTQLQGRWTAHTPAPQQWQLRGHLKNQRPTPWNRGGLPLQHLQANLGWTNSTWTLNTLQATLGQGQLQAQGEWNPSTQHWQGHIQAQGIQAAALLTALPPQKLRLNALAQTSPRPDDASHTPFEVHLDTDSPVNIGTPLSLHLQGLWRPQHWSWTQLDLQAWGAKLQSQGQFDTRQHRVQGQVTWQTPGTQGEWTGAWSSRLGQLQGDGTTQITVHDATQAQNWIRTVAAPIQNVLPTRWSRTSLPTLLKDWKWAGDATLQATWTAKNWYAKLQTTQLTASSEDAPPQTWQLHQWLVSVQGNGSEVELQQNGSLNTPIGLWESNTNLQGTWGPQGLQAQLSQFDLRATSRDKASNWRLRTITPPQIEWRGAQDFTLSAGQVQLTPEAPHHANPSHNMRLQWAPTTWKNGSLRTSGQLQGLPLSWINTWTASPSAPNGPVSAAGLNGEMLFDGEWDVSLPLSATLNTSAPHAHLQLQRSSGDLTLAVPDNPRAAPIDIGLQEARLRLELQDHTLRGQVRWSSERAGSIRADASTPLALENDGWIWPQNAPLSGQVQVQLPQMGLWSSLAPTGWRMRGALDAQATLTGTRSQPVWQGRWKANQLGLRSVIDGLEFSDGELQATFAGDQLQLEAFRIRGAGGTSGGWLHATGTAQWLPVTQTSSASVWLPRLQPHIDLTLRAESLRLLARPDRRLSLSGDVRAQLHGASLDLKGQLRVDQALYLLPEDSTPTLSDDVRIRGQHTPAPSRSPWQTQLAIGIDLGPDFQVRGHGLDTLLRGQVQVQVTPGQTRPRLEGEVRTQRGIYRAYGQILDIETGVLRFNGAYDNPALDILALRPLPSTSQRIGVQVQGSALAPRLTLYADPDLTETDKLAWLVLGRSGNGSGAEAAVLQQAALALLGQKNSGDNPSITRTLGLDEITFRGESTTTTGTTQGAALTLGKRLSNRLYVSYAHSLAGAMGTVAMFYDVSRRLTLRAQAGSENAIDLILTHKYD